MSKKSKSEKMVIQAPTSFIGSAKRLWKLTGSNPAVKAVLALPVIALILLAWCFVLSWYVFFGIFLIPYRLLRRGSRKRKKQEQQHREVLEKIAESTTLSE